MTAQPGIFAFGTSEHCYLELSLLPGADPVQMVAAVAAYTESLSTTGGINVVVGLRPELWPGLAESRPDDAIAMIEDVVGPDGFRMPATQRDAWIWVSGGLGRPSSTPQQRSPRRSRRSQQSRASSAAGYTGRTVTSPVSSTVRRTRRRSLHPRSSHRAAREASSWCRCGSTTPRAWMR